MKGLKYFFPFPPHGNPASLFTDTVLEYSDLTGSALCDVHAIIKISLNTDRVTLPHV